MLPIIPWTFSIISVRLLKTVVSRINTIVPSWETFVKRRYFSSIKSPVILHKRKKSLYSGLFPPYKDNFALII